MTETTDRTEPRRHLSVARELSWNTDPHRGPITTDYAVKLMRLLVAEREDWTPDEVMFALEDCRDQQRVPLRRAAFRIAERPGSTPAEIALTGSHWEAAEVPAAPAPVHRPVRPTGNDTSDPCRRHPHLKEWECRECKPVSAGRGPEWWAEYERVATEERQRRERLAAAEAEDRERRARLGVPEPRLV